MITQEYKHAQSVKNAQLRKLVDRMPIVEYADRRRKIRPHDDGMADTVEKLMQGLVVIAFGLVVLWLALGAS